MEGRGEERRREERRGKEERGEEGRKEERREEESRGGKTRKKEKVKREKKWRRSYYKDLMLISIHFDIHTMFSIRMIKRCCLPFCDSADGVGGRLRSSNAGAKLSSVAMKK